MQRGLDPWLSGTGIAGWTMLGNAQKAQTQNQLFPLELTAKVNSHCWGKAGRNIMQKEGTCFFPVLDCYF